MSHAYAFGIDLAGYTTGRTAVAAVELTGVRAKSWLLRRSAFSKPYRTSDLLAEIVATEAAALVAMCRLGPVAIDVPIDLQNVGKSGAAKLVWQLYKRPVDQAFNAMPALADRLGAPYARMQAILERCGSSITLGKDVFETYPKAGLQVLNLESKGIKGASVESQAARNALCANLGWCSFDSDHDLDALLCAITAGSQRKNCLANEELEARIKHTLPGCDDCRPPRGFILPRKPIPPVRSVVEVEFDEWIGARR